MTNWMMSSRCVALLGVALLSVASVQAARAEGQPTTLSEQVSVAGLDLTTDAGWAQADRRVEDAADRTCGAVVQEGPTSAVDYETCRQDALHDARARLRDVLAMQVREQVRGPARVMLAGRAGPAPRRG